MLCIKFLILLFSALVANVVSYPELNDFKKLQQQVNSLLEAKEQQSQLVEQLKEMRQEISSLHDRCRGIRNVGTRTKWLEASLSEARGQVTELGSAIDRTVNTVNELRSQITANTKAVSKIGISHHQRSYNEVLDKSNEHVELEKKTRHQRALRKRVETLESLVRDLANDHGRFEEKFKTYLDRSVEDNGNSSNVDKVHASVLELLESVEALETKVDTNLPAVQKEVSRTEITLGQLMQQTAVVKEEQDNQKLSLKALSVGMSAVQEKLASFSPGLNTTRHSSLLKVEPATDVISNLRTIISDYKRVMESLPQDCKNVKGRKTRMLRLGDEPRMVVCEDEWVVVQKRKDGSVQFNRDWEEYAKGFGNPEGEFWLGNEGLHELTKNNRSHLKIEMVDIYGKVWIANYSSFVVDSRESGFKLSVSGFTGNASDAMDYQNGMQFSARDLDRDISNTHCAANYEGGWWFSHCQHANLNGRYNLGLTWFHLAKNEWIAVAESTMRVMIV